MRLDDPRRRRVPIPALLTCALALGAGCSAEDVAVPAAPPRPQTFAPERWPERGQPAAVASPARSRGVPAWPLGLEPVPGPSPVSRARDPVPPVPGGPAVQPGRSGQLPPPAHGDDWRSDPHGR